MHFLIILFFLLLVLVSAIFIIYKKDIFEPSFLFSASFLMLTFMGIINYKKWSLNLHINTFLVVILGVFEFALVCFIFKKYYNSHLNKNNSKRYRLVEISEVPKVLEIIYICVSIIICLIFIYCIATKMNSNIKGIKDIINAIGDYDYLTKFTNDFESAKIPFLVSNARFAVIAIGYWFNYIIINNYLLNKKVKPLELIISTIALIATFLDGSRTAAFFYIFAFIAMFFILRNKKNGYTNNLNIKLIRNIVIVLLIFIVTFVPVAKLLGRNVNNIKTFDYLSIYCGGQLKNLDIALQEGPFPKKSELFGSQTFYTLIKTLGTKFHLKNYHPYHLDSSFRVVNGYKLGNVYTTFYPYIYDFGYFGEFILVLIMAIISQMIYEKAKTQKINNKISIFVLMYAFLSVTLLLSFFSNKFYENIFSTIFLKYVLIWIFCNYCYNFLIQKMKTYKTIKTKEQ